MSEVVGGLSLHSFDIFALAVIALCALRVTIVGFVREVSALAWLILGAIAGFLFSGWVGSLLSVWLGKGAFNQVVGFIVVFILVFIVVKLIERSLATILEGLSLQAVDRILGFVLGLVEGVLVVFIVYFLLDWQTVWKIQAEIAQSTTAKLLAPFLPFAKSLVPGSGG